MVETFALAVFVAVLSVCVGAWQSKVVARAIMRRNPVPTANGSGEDGNINGTEEAVALRVGHAIDIAVNLPTAALTLVAFLGLPTLASTPSWIIVLVTITLSGGFILLAHPRNVGWYWAASIKSTVSAVSLVLIAANLIGLVLATRAHE